MPAKEMFSIALVAFLILCRIQNTVGLSRVDPLVQSNVGLIRGLLSEDYTYLMFLGIPYAKVDETNPFGPSSPYPRFENTFEAYNDDAICPQVKNDNVTVDCLHINVFSPTVAHSGNKLPVMVYIYGGAFARGYASRYHQGPKYIMRHNVILVTLNYRVGPYGFMCLDIPEVPGNQGLKDQVLALNWIKNNIEAFGGDPEKITVFGVSAGAHSIDFHLTYGDENLFQNAIVQSGSDLAATVIIEPDKSAPQKLAEHLGVITESVQEALIFLASEDPLSVINAMDQLNMKFKPCIEKKFNGVEPFITESWINVKKPQTAGKSIMVGFTDFERYADVDVPETYIKKNLFRETLAQTFDFDTEKLSEMEQLVQHFYIGNENISEDVKWDLANFDSDFTYFYPIQRSISRYLDGPAKNIFYYQFSYVGGRNNGLDTSNLTINGTIHSDEVGYLFDLGRFWNMNVTCNDQKIIDRMTTMWTNFAKYGNPIPETTELLLIKWTPLTRNDYYYLKIDSELTVDRSPAHSRMAFWDLFYILNEKSQKFYEDIE